MGDMIESKPQGPHAEAGFANAEDGEVVLDGPDGVAVSMLPDPAEETGRSLIEAAKTARAQKDSEPS